MSRPAPPNEDYRDRIYGSYVNARAEALAPTTLAGLESRGPTLRRLIERHFPGRRDARILDLGCGHGALIHFARAAGYTDISGVDSSSEQVDAAKRLGISGVERRDVMDGLGEASAASLDAVVAFDIIEHFRKDEILGLVDEAHRVLTPGGRWILHVPNAESPFFGRVRYGDITHEQAFTRVSISQLLRASGFADVRCFEDVPIVHGAKSAARWAMWRVVRTMLKVSLAAEIGADASNAVLSQNLLVVATK